MTKRPLFTREEVLGLLDPEEKLLEDFAGPIADGSYDEFMDLDDNLHLT